MAVLFEQYNSLVQEQGFNTNKNITVGGSANFDMSGSTGTFKTPTGAATLGGSLTIAAGKNLSMAAGAGAVDFSGATGTFKFPTGAVSGQTQTVLSAQGAGPTTLTAAQSGAIVLFDRAAGNAYVLPAPVVGLTFTFITTVSVTSNSSEFVTDAGTTFLLGSVSVAPNGSNVGLSEEFSGDGSSHVEFTMNGTTQGGLIGSQVTATCVTSTPWNVTGIVMGSGTLVTPFTT